MGDSDQVDELIASWKAELPEALGPATELVKRVMSLAAEMAAVTRRELPAFDLTPAEFDVLVTLRRIGPPYRLRPNELSGAVLLSSGGTSNIINRLGARCLVRRLEAPGDGRGALIELTDGGRALAERAVLAEAAAQEKLFAGLPPELVARATEALRAVGATLRRC
ncbi:MarR family winged helix-turn-helix transcriptional regulator [Streptomyces litchfieldiae]|uniref:MarR family transcriptional regulator n=1 Tax=Streptomyces litchfieldiae TaxID=3075543 RepID=A0ABU2MQP7_9ACTN|nr:MarR family transcriptional regulator [Streptomyces sp. DSM 44938]MDT0342924.1 MarR family transcriptional regulator [Streptomyces sp. DSM 44938]